MEQQESEDQLQLRVGEDERIGDSDPEDQDDRESEAPRDSLSYKEAIVKLRARLGSSVCPKPEVKSKSIGASALDFFKDPEQVEEASLALPQSNSVSISLGIMDKRLKGEEEVPMSLLPTYPKGFKSGSFVSINIKPKIFQASSYEALNLIINIQFSTLENLENLLGREFKLHLTQRYFCVEL